MTAAAFVDPIGVNTHFPYSGTPYVDRFDEVCAKLQELGVRHIRDGGAVKWGQDPKYMQGTWDRLNRQPCDILYVLAPHEVYDPTVPKYPYRLDYGATDIALIRSKLGAKVVAWEGLNEPDLKVGTSDWAAKTLQFQQAARKDADAPLLVSALGHPWKADRYAACGFGLWDHGDIAAWHPYAENSKSRPDTPYFDANLKLLRRYSAGLPIWATEAGYDTAGLDSSVDEEYQAAYLLQTLQHHLAAGVQRTYLYELVDEKPANGREMRLGLLRNDLTEKPAFTLLKSILRGLTL